MSSKNKETKKKKETTEFSVKTEEIAGMKLLIRTLDTTILSTESYIELPVKCGEKKNEVFLIPGIEGCATIFSSLTPLLKLPATCLQSRIYDNDQSIEEMAERFVPHVLNRSKGRRDFVIVGYSYGSMIAIELARRLEAYALVGHLILIDGSPAYLKAIKEIYFTTPTEGELQNQFLIDILKLSKSTTMSEFKSELSNLTTWNEKLEKLVQHVPVEVYKEYTPENLKTICTSIFNRICLITKYDPTSLPPLRTPITLLKPQQPAVLLDDPSYDLNKLTYGKVNIHVIEGNHVSMLDNVKVAAAINDEPLDDKEMFKDALNYASDDVGFLDLANLDT